MTNISMLFIFVPLLSAILLAINFILAPSAPYFDKVSPYECGYNVIPGQTRGTFHIHFYLVSMLFLIFDLEIILLLPIAVTLIQVSLFGFTIALIFFIILTLGFILEFSTGAINLNTINSNNY